MTLTLILVLILFPWDYSAPEAFELIPHIAWYRRTGEITISRWIWDRLIRLPGFLIFRDMVITSGFTLSKQQVKYIRLSTENVPARWIGWWMKKGLPRFLAEQLTVVSIYRPDLCWWERGCCGRAQRWFARILDFSAWKVPSPNNLPNYLLHTWYGITKGGKIFPPQRWFRYPLLAEGSSPGAPKWPGENNNTAACFQWP